MSWRLDICLLIDGFARTLSRGTAFATNRRINWELFSREPDRNEQKPKLSAWGVDSLFVSDIYAGSKKFGHL
jgi:hypothetical protein